MKKTKDPATCMFNNAGGEPSFDPIKWSRVPRRSLFVPVNFELWPKGLISNFEYSLVPYVLLCSACAFFLEYLFIIILLFMFFAISSFFLCVFSS